MKLTYPRALWLYQQKPGFHGFTKWLLLHGINLSSRQRVLWRKGKVYVDLDVRTAPDGSIFFGDIS